MFTSEREEKNAPNKSLLLLYTKGGEKKHTSNNYPLIHTNAFFLFIDNIICKKNLGRNDFNPTKIND